MICSSCSTNVQVGAFSWNRACGRLATWFQCRPCFVAEEQRIAEDRADDLRRKR